MSHWARNSFTWMRIKTHPERGPSQPAQAVGFVMSWVPEGPRQGVGLLVQVWPKIQQEHSQMEMIVGGDGERWGCKIFPSEAPGAFEAGVTVQGGGTDRGPHLVILGVFSLYLYMLLFKSFFSVSS